MGRGRTTLSALAIAAALALPALALGGVAKPKDPTIDPPRSIAGIELGMRLKEADRLWGGTGECKRSRPLSWCEYGGRGRGSAEIAAKRGRVRFVGIAAPIDKNLEVSFFGPLMELRTVEGIGLGSEVKDVGDAYPAAKKLSHRNGYVLAGPGSSKMLIFSVGSEGKRRVTSIFISRYP